MKCDYKNLSCVAYRVRYWSIAATTAAGSGHPTSCLSAADIIATLFCAVMSYDIADPHSLAHDRFILSKGHAAPVLYAIWHEIGLVSEEELLSLRSFDSILEGHPTSRFPLAEAATGSLGQGLSIGIGYALAARAQRSSGATYVLLGDAECAEGSVWEAAEVASHYGLANLRAIVDLNRLGQSGQTVDGWDAERMAAKWRAFGWHVIIVNGHDVKQLVEGFAEICAVHDRPSVIIACTIKGYGVKRCENREGFHGKVFSQKELPDVLAELAERFPEIAHCAAPSSSVAQKKYVETSQLSHATVIMPSPTLLEKQESYATRKAVGEALCAIGAASDRVVVLDADVKNSTYTEFFADTFPERFYECYVAEQNMVGMGVGFALSGFIPFIATFGAFFTRAHDHIRMAAISRAPLRLIGSHVGVSIGQDGPSQMALEDIAMMRAIPHSVVLYPADAISAYRLVECAANYHEGISYIRATRSETPKLYNADTIFFIGGCHVVRRNELPQICIIGAGITLFEALHADDILCAEGIQTTVIDCYSVKPLPYTALRDAILQAQGRCIVVEDHYQEGGLGEAIAAALCNESVQIALLAVKKMPRSGSPERLRAYEEIDAAAIVAVAHVMLKK